MIIYIADRDLNITAQASTSLPGGFRIVEDTTTEEIESGVNTFSCRISYNDSTRQELEGAVEVGRFVIKQSGRAFSDKENIYDSLYQIIETEFDTKSQELNIYAEDAGLDLLGKVCDAITLTNKTLSQMMITFKPSDWTLSLVGTPTTTKTYTWDGESTCTERLRSVALLWDCELYYSFQIERFEISAKTINVIPKRGNQTATAQLRLNYDIDRIVTKKSIADLTTAYVVTGSTPSGANAPVNLKGYSYSYTDPDTGDVYAVDTTTGQMRNTSAMKRWSSVLDADGLIVKSFSYETTDKAVLAGQARAALQKVDKTVINYEVDFARLPADIRIGDRVNIIDEDGKLYLEARLLKLESSASAGTQKATIGEFVLKDSGISDYVITTAAELASMVKLKPYELTIISSAGSDFITTNINTTLTASVLFNGELLTWQEIASRGLTIKWYDTETDTLLGSGMTYTVSNEATINVTARLEET